MRPERPRPELVRAFGDGAGAPGGTRVLVIHPGALPAAHYAGLAAALPPGAGLHVMDLEQVPEYFRAALDSGRVTTSIDGLAARAADEFRARGLLSGPWTLLGWSFGGVVGHALAGLLEEAERPLRLVLLDSIAPVPGYVQPEDAIGHRLALPWFCMYLAAKRDGDPDALPAAFPDVAEDRPEEALDRVLRAGLDSGILRPGTTLPGLRKVYDTYLDGLRRNNRLAAAHDPRPVSLPITLLRPRRGLLDTPDPLGWSRLGDDLRTGHVPGDHYSMLRDPEALRRIAAAAVPATAPVPG
ncbi:thioesterase domain-containing protein [Streptomyces sp. DH37]|uniref:thioesterase domain-containing protein n=1 Tax=Streptomyces sp. DH37 TaxID=3040122 RepID=UPI00244323EE|nr:thioesterase domain-containing protein [Streptomyces sp. DH37]MDG9702017.1 thioesterase domain-containing protein [Streptomyces sp. DH37]